MQKNNVTTVRKVVKSCGVVGGTILLGAIDSGSWETVLSPALTGLSNGVLSFLSAMFSAYADALHARIALDGSDAFTQVPFAAASALMLTLPLMIYIAMRNLFRLSDVSRELMASLRDDDSGEELTGDSPPPALSGHHIGRLLDLLSAYRRTAHTLTFIVSSLLVCAFLYITVRAGYTRQAAIYIM